MWNIKKKRKKKRKEIKGKKSQIHGNRVELRVGVTKAGQDPDQRVQNFSYKMSKFCGLNAQHYS